MTEEQPKIHIDAGWKAEARAEKERLAKESEMATAERADRPGPGELPKADFRSLVNMLASQAFMGLGALADPKSGRPVVDLPGSRFAIELLAMMGEKTKGNLDDEESKELTQLLTELRARFVQISEMVAKQNVGDVDAAAAPPGSC